MEEGARDRASASLAQVGLLDRAGDRPRILSGGQRQRVALARALASMSRMLLPDEPLGALDALTRLEMQQLIEALWLRRRFTVLLVTHGVVEAVALADRVILIEEGRIEGDFDVPLPRPRQRNGLSFVSVKEEILEQLLKGGQREAVCLEPRERVFG